MCAIFVFDSFKRNWEGTRNACYQRYVMALNMGLCVSLADVTCESRLYLTPARNNYGWDSKKGLVHKYTLEKVAEGKSLFALALWDKCISEYHTEKGITVLCPTNELHTLEVATTKRFRKRNLNHERTNGSLTVNSNTCSAGKRAYFKVPSLRAICVRGGAFLLLEHGFCVVRKKRLKKMLQI